MAHVARGARVAALHALEQAAAFLSGGTLPVAAVPWEQLGPDDAAVVRSWAVTTLPPFQANRVLAAMRGILRQPGRDVSPDEDGGRVFQRLGRHREKARGRGLSMREIEALFFVCDRDQSASGMRDAAIIGLMAAAGLGQSQIAGLRPEDFDADEQTLRFCAAPGRVRWKADLAATRVARDLKRWSRAAEGGGHLFMAVDKGGNVVAGRPMLPASLSRLLRARSREAGLTAVHAWDLRLLFLRELRRRSGHPFAAAPAAYGRDDSDGPFVAFTASDMFCGTRWRQEA